MPPTNLDQDRVALTLLRYGSDTLAPRAFGAAVWPQIHESTPAARALELLVEALGLPPDAGRDQVSAARRAALTVIATAQALGLGFVSVLQESYPTLLHHIADPPLGLWVQGDIPPPGETLVAVIGSRNALPASLTMARQLARGLAEAGLVVVSGLARGVDEAAHRGALEGGGRTVAVLGSGLDVIYPAEHAGLARRIEEAGALLTELPPGTRPLARHFPMRNRIISGLSRAVVVVEASEKSGSLITARAALEQGRDVLAVPGGVLSGCHRGCHALIKDGARLVETVEDVLDELAWPRRPPAVGSQQPPDRHPLLALMRAGEPMALDEFAMRTGRPAPDLLAELGGLELAGKVGRAAGGAFLRLDGSATYRERNS